MTWKLPLKSLFIGLSVLLMTGCGYIPTDNDVTSVDVSWSIGGSTCTARGIATVQVTLYTPSRIEDTVTTACQLGHVELSNVSAGIYNIRVDGYPAQSDYPTYGGEITGVAVRSGTPNVAPSVEMAEKPGALDLTWRFGDGALCAFAGVDTVEVSLWDEHSNRSFFETLSCNPSLARDEAESLDPTRSLIEGVNGILIEDLYAGHYTMQAMAYPADRTLGATHWANAEPKVVHAQVTPVELVFQPCTQLMLCN
jgi:hypothetical protein